MHTTERVVTSMVELLRENLPLLQCSPEDKKRGYFILYYTRLTELLDGAVRVCLCVSRVKLRTEGLETLPEGPFLLVSNHRSNYDPIVTWSALKSHRVAFVSKQANFRIPIFGRLIRKCGCMAIDRENPRKALACVKNAAALLERGENCVGIYPEGTRSKQCVLLEFHNSVFKIAQMAHAPIVVMTVEGTEKIHKNAPWRQTEVGWKVIMTVRTVRVDMKLCGIWT
mgnify:CR=1 FL=1